METAAHSKSNVGIVQPTVPAQPEDASGSHKVKRQKLQQEEQKQRKIRCALCPSCNGDCDQGRPNPARSPKKIPTEETLPPGTHPLWATPEFQKEQSSLV